MRTPPSVPLQSYRSDPSSDPVAENAPAPSVFWSAGFACWLGGIFILYSRFFDVVLYGYRIPRGVLSLMVLFFLLSGKPLVFLRSTAGKVMLGLVSWVSLTLFFSVWKGGSIPVYYTFLQSVLIFAIAAGMPSTLADVRKSTYTLAISGLVAVLLSFPFAGDLAGRLTLHQGSYGDPNAYAMAIIAIVPFFWNMARSAKSNVIKIFAWLCMVPLFWTLMRTGSRGAMLSLVVMLVLLLLISPIKTKIVLVCAIALGFVAVITILPEYIRARYLTLFDSPTNQYVQSSEDEDPEMAQLHADADSAAGRRRLLFTSIALTLEHPLFGVGPGNFPAAVFDESHAKGVVHNEWLVTHNSYTQISSETGFIGFFLFVALIVLAFRNIAIVLKGTAAAGAMPDPNTNRLAKYLLLSMAALCVCIFFLAVGYDFTIYVWVGLTISLRRAYEERRAAFAQTVDLEYEEARPAKFTVGPAYARVKDRLPQRTDQAGAPPKAEGRPVRFNRFR